MQLSTRKVLDRSFSGLGMVSIVLVTCSLVVFLAPIVWKGFQAFCFRGTIEYRRVMLDQFDRGNAARIEKEADRARAARQPLYDMLEQFEEQLKQDRSLRRKYRRPLRELKMRITGLLGPAPGEPQRVLIREQYGQTRWDRARVKLQDVLYKVSYDYSDPSVPGIKVQTPRA